MYRRIIKILENTPAEYWKHAEYCQHFNISKNGEELLLFSDGTIGVKNTSRGTRHYFGYPFVHLRGKRLYKKMYGNKEVVSRSVDGVLCLFEA